ncbi:MAG: hypothetical protein CM15mV137_070 [uncultured marine virus]|nr:MAG: hypothetical protein CM15mV137_070 [uncultured marine virus]
MQGLVILLQMGIDIGGSNSQHNATEELNFTQHQIQQLLLVQKEWSLIMLEM